MVSGYWFMCGLNVAFLIARLWPTPPENRHLWWLSAVAAGITAGCAIYLTPKDAA